MLRQEKQIIPRQFATAENILLCLMFIFVSPLFLSSCRDQPVKPQPVEADTTSQEFTQETFVFGEPGTSLFADVAIVNDTLAYAVGEIYVKDSLGNIEQPSYGLAVWDGRSWTLRRLLGFFQDVGHFSWINAYGVFALSANNVWLAQGHVYSWDGKSEYVKVHPIGHTPTNPNPVLGPNQSIQKIWASSNTNLFGVGWNGAIAHYDGTTWKRIESGTSAHINDVWGAFDKESNEYVTLCAVSNTYEVSERRILRIYSNGTIDSLPWRYDRRCHSIWFERTRKVFTAGGGVFISDGIGTWEEQDVPSIFTRRIRGVAENDVFISGDFGLISHYNGIRCTSWQLQGAGIMFSNDYKGGLFITVGSTMDAKGLIVMQRRK